MEKYECNFHRRADYKHDKTIIAMPVANEEKSMAKVLEEILSLPYDNLLVYPESGMHPREVLLPGDVIAQGYDTITILPYGGDSLYSAEYLQLN